MSADQNFVMEILGPRNRSKHCMDSEALQKTSNENGRRNGVELGHGNRFFLTNIWYADDLKLLATSSNDLI